MKYIFPFSKISKNEKIILYGASECGYDFYRQLISTDFAEVVLWVDKQYEWYRYMNLPVDAPERILCKSFDRVVIATDQKNIYQSILEDLIEFGVDKKKIFWQEEYKITGNVAASYDKNRIIREAESAITIDTRQFIREDRLDIVIRILYAADIINCSKDSYNQELYRKLMMVQNGGKEPTEDMMSAFFSEYALKSGWEAFDQSFRNLLNSMKNVGFSREHFVPIDCKGNLINGAHRVAAAFALGLDVWAYKYIVGIRPLVFDREWLKNKGFDEKDIEYVSEQYKRIVGEGKK